MQPRRSHSPLFSVATRRRSSALITATVALTVTLTVVVSGAAIGQTDPSTTTSSTVPPASTAASSTTVPSTLSGSTPTSAAPTSSVPTSVPSTSPTTAATPSTAAPSTAAPTSTTTPPTTLKPGTIVIPPGKVLKVGSKGDDVRALETRLAQLNIDTGKVDGRFDWSTWQGVVAFQKYWGLKRTGKVDNDLRVKIQSSPDLNGFIFSGPPTRLEVDKSKQLLFMFRNNQLWRVVSISSGSDKKYCEFSKKAQRQVCGTAHTPTGRFKIQRRISGWRESDLGRLYNPLYFNGGIAFHGAPSVPAYPASHGCVRLPMPIAEWFPDEVDNGTAVYVYD